MKKFVVLAICVLMVFAVSMMVLTAGKTAPAGQSNTAHLYLYEKDPVTWAIVEGAWGKMQYNLAGPTFDFVFNGHGLVAGAEYKLIYYPDPWPGVGLKCLGIGTANNGGNVHIAESINLSMDLGDSASDLIYGAKIWLVLSEDVSNYPSGDQKMIGWHPESYLFEGNGIFYNDTDD
ncbi:MAG: hypothetical protein AAB116_04710 [Candidatus Poribacteria bacterium]